MEACNGIVECFDGSDERWTCSNDRLILCAVLGSCLIILFIFLTLKYRTGEFKPDRSLLDLKPGHAIEEMDSLLKNSDDSEFKNKLSYMVVRNQFLPDATERITIIYRSILDHHVRFRI